MSAPSLTDMLAGVLAFFSPTPVLRRVPEKEQGPHRSATPERTHMHATPIFEAAQGKASPSKEDKLSSFDRDQAEKTGADARTVRRSAERGEKISASALALVKGTHLDTGKFLDEVKALPKSEQAAFVRSKLDEPKQRKRKAGAHAPDPEDDYTVRERQVSALMNAWNKAGKEAREQFLDRIGASA